MLALVGKQHAVTEGKLVEIERLLSDDDAAVAGEVEAVLCADGHIVLHGAELAAVGSALRSWEAFAGLPLAIRERYRRNSQDGYGGWLLMRDEPVYTSHMDTEEAATDEPKQEFGSMVDVVGTRWPSDDEAPGFAGDVAAMSALLDQVARRLLGAFEHVLGEEPGFLRYAPAHFALKHYPGKPDGASTQTAGLHEHSDCVVFTMLSQNRPSLQMRGRDGNWVAAPADTAGALTVIPGDWMELFTNGRIPAARHRVLDTEQPRVSLAFFQNIDRMPVGPLSRFTSADNPARYPEVMSDIDYIGGESGVPRWQSHVGNTAGPLS